MDNNFSIVYVTPIVWWKQAIVKLASINRKFVYDHESIAQYTIGLNVVYIPISRRHNKELYTHTHFCMQQVPSVDGSSTKKSSMRWT